MIDRAPDPASRRKASNMPNSDGLHVNGVSKKFPGPRGTGDTTVLDNIDLQVHPGEFVCLVGPSGCGKTTLLNMMAGFDQPTTGSLTLDHTPIMAPGPERVMVFQDYALFPWLDVRRNVEYGLRIAGVPRSDRRRRALDAIELVGLAAHASQAVYRLSGGMRQRVALARALVLQPKVLLMDEPFAALDAQQRTVLQQETLRVWRETGQTIVFVTHSLEEALVLADRVVLLDPHPGRVAMLLDVELPRPRDVTTPDFNDMRRTLDTRLRAGLPAEAPTS